ncbi:MHS family proline/betaine transporter-like MFS transporter [Neomicrococcus aestuarii]|uniref:Putative proline/betaine transporter n=1 Tax=Neomicrococcus aestuarii TaxID=556325 RepID=A0A7W8TUH9_9MICC|nr:MFS transporter [Neomicrococcus aestuarii]MBB5512350.1 MHS family proline/betaine transporter-like MFS transporter [Neomicrococcus aestuarii]
MDTQLTHDADTSPASLQKVPQAQLNKVVRASFAGTVVEWFDFAIYGYMATHLAAAFFSSEDPIIGLLETFAVFAVAFALRPLGGIFFGRLGDRIGRKSTLVLTVLLMSGSTAAIGLIPTHEQIGVWAAVLLVLARCLQGFSAGGEYAGATIYVVEHSPDHQRARNSSAMSSATFASFALAAGIGAILSRILPPEAMGEWGWRILFLLSVPLGLVAFYIRSKLQESPEFEALKENREEREAPPLKEVFRTQGPSMLKLGGFVMLTALSFYIYSTYMSTFLTVVVGLSKDLALFSSLISLTLAAIGAPFLGRLADRIGRRRTMQLSAGLLALLTIPSYLIAEQSTLLSATISQILIGLGAATANVVTSVLMSEMFSTDVRYTASGICYNITYAIFGGTAPFIATWLVASTGNGLSPAIYVSIIAVLAFLVATFAMPETAGKPLRRYSSEPLAA